jgi:hypothetical protein
MLAMVCLLGITYVINNNWNENYGDAQLEVIKTFQHAFEEVQKDRKVMLVGLIQSLFEAAMYTFVFMWTPTLSASAPVSQLDRKIRSRIFFGFLMVTFASHRNSAKRIQRFTA